MTQQQCTSDQSNGDNDSAEAVHPRSRSSFTPWLTPGSVLLFSTIPLGLGGYIGYRRALHASSKSSSTSSSKSASKGGLLGGKGYSIVGQIIHHPEPPISSSSQSISSKGLMSSSSRAVSTTPPHVLAARALAIGSLLSISGTSLLISGIFFASGCDSIDELMSTWKSWAPKKLKRIEDSLEALGIPVGGRERRSTITEYEQAVVGMTEEEELDYVANKYGGEIRWDTNSEGGDTNK